MLVQVVESDNERRYSPRSNYLQARRVNRRDDYLSDIVSRRLRRYNEELYIVPV